MPEVLVLVVFRKCYAQQVNNNASNSTQIATLTNCIKLLLWNTLMDNI